MAFNLTLTNYISKLDGTLKHGSELSYFDRFKSGNWQKINSYQANQNMPYSKGVFNINGKNYFEIVRTVYNKEVPECFVEKIGDD